MIDDGAAETKTFTDLGIRFIICAFHFLKAIMGWIDKSDNKNQHMIANEDICN
jgi:hypothetical protein